MLRGKIKINTHSLFYSISVPIHGSRQEDLRVSHPGEGEVTVLAGCIKCNLSAPLNATGTIGKLGMQGACAAQDAGAQHGMVLAPVDEFIPGLSEPSPAYELGKGLNRQRPPSRCPQPCVGPSCLCFLAVPLLTFVVTQSCCFRIL